MCTGKSSARSSRELLARCVPQQTLLAGGFCMLRFGSRSKPGPAAVGHCVRNQEAVPMDIDKCNVLKADLMSVPDPIVPIDRFFDGNDDPGSIGCNLIEHPGINQFREVLVGLTQRADVEAVYAQIAELDPGEDSWPFTDTVL